MILTRWIKFDTAGTPYEEAPSSPRYGAEHYTASGYTAVPEALQYTPMSYIHKNPDGTIVEIEPEIVDTTEIVSKRAVIAVFKELIQTTVLEDTALLKNILGGIADLTTDLAPGDEFNLLDPHVELWLEPLGMTVDDLRSAIEAYTETASSPN